MASPLAVRELAAGFSRGRVEYLALATFATTSTACRIATCGSRNKFCRHHSFAPGTLATLESHFEHLPPDPEPAPGSLTAGVAVGPWVLLSRLGRGGGADVWGAFAEEHGEVALKIPHPGFYQRKRFVTECSVMQKLNGTMGVMPVIAHSGFSDTEIPWLAMPMAQPIRSVVNSADASSIVAELVQIAEAL